MSGWDLKITLKYPLYSKISKFNYTYRSNLYHYFNFMDFKYNYKIRNNCKLLVLYKFILFIKDSLMRLKIYTTWS